MPKWLSLLFKSGPLIKHWWRERHDGTYKIVVSVDGELPRMIASVAFAEGIPLQAQHAAMARMVKGLDNE